MAPALAWQICFCILPLLFVIQLSFCSDLFSNFTFEFFTKVTHSSHFFVMFRSFLLASTTAICCLLIGYPVAFYVALRAPASMKTPLIFLIILPFLTNLLVQVYAWFFILEKHGFINNLLYFLGFDLGCLLNSQFAMYLVMFHVYLPFMIMPLYSTLEKVNVRLIEASLDLRASYFQTLCRIVFPLTIQGIQTGFFLVYVTSFGEYAIPSLIAGQKNYFVGTMISEYFFIGQDWHVGAAFTCLSSVLFIGTIICYQSLLKRLIKRLQRI